MEEDEEEEEELEAKGLSASSDEGFSFHDIISSLSSETSRVSSISLLSYTGILPSCSLVGCRRQRCEGRRTLIFSERFIASS